jgi:hypothetical protein
MESSKSCEAGVQAVVVWARHNLHMAVVAKALDSLLGCRLNVQQLVLELREDSPVHMEMLRVESVVDLLVRMAKLWAAQALAVV